MSATQTERLNFSTVKNKPEYPDFPDIQIRHHGQISWGSKHYIGLRHNYNSAIYYLGKYRGKLYKAAFVLFVKTMNILYLPLLFLLWAVTMGRNVKIKDKLKS